MTKFNILEFKAILFDLDNTLTNTNGYAIRASAWTLEQCTSEPDEIIEPFLMTLVRNYRYETHRVGNNHHYISPYDCVRNAIDSTIREMNLDADISLAEEGAALFKRLHLELSKPFPEVELLLKKFKSNRMKLGVLTNSFEKNARIILERYALAPYFDTILDGSDVRIYKPNPKAFNFALNILNTSPSESLFIGDEFHADIVGAITAGMSTVWINTRNQNLQDQLAKYGQNMKPNLVIKSFDELETYL